MTTNAVSLKLPEFWESAAPSWFAQAEAQFMLREITADATKYYYVVAALNSSTANRVVSILENPPEQDKYETLKGQLLKTFGLSEAERAHQLLTLQGLGDSKPSELMDKMLALLGKNKPDFLFRHLFLHQLPTQVRAALANTTVTDCRALAEEADKIFLVGFQHCAAAQAPAQAASSKPESLTHIAAATTTAQRQRPNGWCYYHTRFGPSAKRCRSPCTFRGTGNGGAGAQ